MLVAPKAKGPAPTEPEEELKENGDFALDVDEADVFNDRFVAAFAGIGVNEDVAVVLEGTNGGALPLVPKNWGIDVLEETGVVEWAADVAVGRGECIDVGWPLEAAGIAVGCLSARFEGAVAAVPDKKGDVFIPDDFVLLTKDGGFSEVPGPGASNTVICGAVSFSASNFLASNFLASAAFFSSAVLSSAAFLSSYILFSSNILLCCSSAFFRMRVIASASRSCFSHFEYDVDVRNPGLISNGLDTVVL